MRYLKRTLLSLLPAVLLLAVVIVRTAPAAAQVTPPDETVPTDTFTLTRLGLTDQVAVGGTPVLNFFFPGPGDYLLAPSGSYFEMIFSHSPILLQRFSRLSVQLNGLELTGLRLGPDNVEKTTLRLPLASDRILPGINKVTMNFVMNSEETCGAINDPAIFTRVYRETSMHYQYVAGFPQKPPNTDLALFPYPLLRTGYTRAGSIVFVLPDDPSQEELSAAATASAAIARVGNSPNYRVTVVPAGSFQAESGRGHDLVVVGTARSNPIVGRVLGNQSFPAGTGALRMAVSPFDRERAALVITGESNETVLRAALALGDRRLRPGLSGDTATITEISDRLEAFPLRAPNVRFAFFELGVSNMTVTGIFAPSLTINFPSLSPDLTADAQVRLILSHSPVMDEKRSSLRFLFNGVALTSVGLIPDNRERTAVDILIPQRVLRPGINSFQVDFNHHLPPDDNPVGLCGDIAPERAWTTIYDDSTIQIQGGPSPEQPDVSYFPYPFLQTQGMFGTVLVSGKSPESLRDCLMMAASLARRNRSDIDAIGMAFGEQLTGEQKQNFYLLAMGRPTDNAFIKDLSRTMPLRYESTSDRVLLDRASVRAAVKDAGTLGVYEVSTSPFNAQRWGGIISAPTLESMATILQALERPRDRGTVVLAQSPEDIRDVRLLPENLEAIVKKQQRADLIMPALTFAIGAITVGSAGWWVYSSSRLRSGRGIR